jgi:hypothetical protein
MVGVSIWERVWLKNSLSQLEGEWRGRGGSVYKAGSESLMTHMEVAGGYVNYNWLKLFLSQTLSHMDTPTILKWVIIYLLACKMEQTECSEMSAYKIQTPGNYPEENIQEGSLLDTRYTQNLNVCSKLTGLGTLVVQL